MDRREPDRQYIKFCAYGFLRNLRLFEAFLIIFLLDRGMNYTQIGILYALREISANVLEIPSGIAADVFGRRRTLAGSFLAYILSFLLFYIFSDFLLYGAAFILYGAGEAFRSGTHKGMIANYLQIRGEKSSMAAYYGRTRSWSQLGLALSSLLAGALVFISGNFSGIFLFSTVPFLINFFLILSYPRDLDGEPGTKDKGKRERLREVLSQSLRSLKDREVLNLLNLTALHTAYLKAVKDYVQPVILSLVLAMPLFESYTTDQRAAVLIGLVYFIIYFLSSRASAGAGKVDGKSLKNIPLLTLGAGLAAGAAGGIFHMFGLSYVTVFLFLIIHLVENLRKPIMTGYVSDHVSNRILTSVLSVQSQMKTILTALIALIFGFIADRAGVGQALLFVSMGLILFSSLPLLGRAGGGA